MKSVLTVAGFDPSGGAGLQADLRVIHSLALHGLSVATAITAQNTRRVADVFPLEEEVIWAELDTILIDITPAATKTGMLYSTGAVEAVRRAALRYGLANIVIDPVIASTSGARLMLEDAVEAMKSHILPLARVITPNTQEAELLTGIKCDTTDAMRDAALELVTLGADAALIKGGHLDGAPDDVLFDGSEYHILTGRRQDGCFHGTGCALSAAIACHLAMGMSVYEAAQRSKEFMGRALAAPIRPGGGMAVPGC